MLLAVAHQVAVFSRVLSPKEVRIFLHVPKTWRTYVAVKVGMKGSNVRLVLSL